MRLEEAIKIRRKCKPESEDTDCSSCPIGKIVAFDAHDAGVHVVFTVCGMLLAIEDTLEKPDDYIFRRDLL